MTAPSTAPQPDAPGARRHPIAIEDAASYVLRIGVVSSVVVFLIGILLSFGQGGLTRGAIETQTIRLNLPSLRHGLATFQGFAWLELGTCMLIATPIVRVFAAMVLFAVEEHDTLYTVVTFLVLVLTVVSLVFIR